MEIILEPEERVESSKMEILGQDGSQEGMAEVCGCPIFFSRWFEWKKMKMRRWCETRNRIWSSVEMETKMKAELVFCEDGDEAQVEDGWQWMVSHRKSEMVFSSAVDGDSQEVGDGDKTQVGLNFGGGWQRRGRRRSRLEWERKP
ncbi:uncharacterized protein LOC127791142 isoform X2 [Diospyros lotus]|uniref:uncharacterized protein LOC127791142 isoform X2 n=1 Tax=Diospyros lotus TaxID=55363 RepID=UPI00225C1231|nr:uncharacterized protein LOC127791142 isoform X2 [Diospyros lotus]